MTLIEVLVGIAIGLIGMLVMFQMVSVWEDRTRVSTAGGDAQVAGTLAMFRLESDLRSAGLGFGTALPSEAGCTVNAYDDLALVSRNFMLLPIQIIDGGTTGPDTIQTIHGSSPFFVQGEQFSAGTPNQLSATVKYGFKRGDLAVATDGAATCRLVQITDDTQPDTHLLKFDTGSYNDYYTGQNAKPVRYNPVSAPLPTISAGFLYSLGNAPTLNQWTVDGTDTLSYSNLLPTVDVNPTVLGIAEGIVDMKAQYGYDSDNDNNISDAEWTKVLPTPTDWTKVRAIRVALLVRSRDFAKPAQGDSQASSYKLTSAPQWSGGPFNMKNLDQSAGSIDIADSPSNWRYYRYRVFERVIPLRNMQWGQT